MIFCQVCSVRLSGPIDYANHINGRRHRSKEGSSQQPQSQSQVPPQAPPQAQNPNSRRGRYQRGGYGATRAGPAHINPQPGLNSANSTRPQHFAAPNANNRRGGAPRGLPRGINPVPRRQPQRDVDQTNNPDSEPRRRKRPRPAEKTYDVDFGVIQNTETKKSRKTFNLTPSDLGQISGTPEVNIAYIKPSRAASVKAFSQGPIARVGLGYNIDFDFDPKAIGRGVHVVVAHIKYPLPNGQITSRTFKLKAILGSLEDHQDLKPVTPYEPLDEVDLRDDWQRERMVLEKPKLPASELARLPYYDVPDDYWAKAQRYAGRDMWGKMHLESLLPHIFQTSTYAKHWKLLLWHEEIAMCNQLKQYDMENVQILRQPQTQKHSLDVPGLEEKRPSVMVTDLIAIRKPGHANPVYGGYVTDVQRSNVLLQLHADFPNLAAQRWDTRFTVNRLVLRRMHDAISKAAPAFDRILFPVAAHQKERTALPRMSLDRRISTNARQKLAVEQIASLSPGDIPFIIFGPPGTGKTTVVVEAIHQVLKAHPGSRLLVCAPSNSAADLLGLRLAHAGYNTRELLRLNAPSRSVGPWMDYPLRKYSIRKDDTFATPSKDELINFRIVVSTCSSASTPRALRIENHFTHIFIDEAGHASEPEIMIPILQNASKDTNIILSGDPKQLGPIVQSKACEALGMAESLLDRLTKRAIYKVELNSTSKPNVVKLLQNYRNHPAILNFPNQVFYGGELEACADPVITHRLISFHELPKAGFPIIFHSICGENQREGKSPSYFNIDEVTLVRNYVNALLDEGKYGLNAGMIGVIAPYRQQISKIRQRLSKEGFGGVEVKVTEDWQGQEKRVIIISTVRSDPELVEEGALQFLGFVRSPRRTNVALTRAQALLIVIGNGPVLMLDPFWNAFIRYVNASGGCTGDDLYLSDDFNSQLFDELRNANRDYMQRIDNENLWEVLKGATKGWNPAD